MPVAIYGSPNLSIGGRRLQQKVHEMKITKHSVPTAMIGPAMSSGRFKAGVEAELDSICALGLAGGTIREV